MCEPSKIVGTIDNLLHKGGFRIEQSIAFQYPMDLANTLGRIHHALEDCLHDYCVKRTARKRKIMRITNQLRSGAERNVGFNESHGWIGNQGFHSVPKNAAANNKNCRFRYPL